MFNHHKIGKFQSEIRKIIWKIPNILRILNIFVYYYAVVAKAVENRHRKRFQKLIEINLLNRYVL